MAGGGLQQKAHLSQAANTGIKPRNDPPILISGPSHRGRQALPQLPPTKIVLGFLKNFIPPVSLICKSRPLNEGTKSSCIPAPNSERILETLMFPHHLCYYIFLTILVISPQPVATTEYNITHHRGERAQKALRTVMSQNS